MILGDLPDLALRWIFDLPFEARIRVREDSEVPVEGMGFWVRKTDPWDEAWVLVRRVVREVRNWMCLLVGDGIETAATGGSADLVIAEVFGHFDGCPIRLRRQIPEVSLISITLLGVYSKWGALKTYPRTRSHSKKSYD